MKHSGGCTKQCGHLLDCGHAHYTQLIQRALDNDPRVIEYYELPEDPHGQMWQEFVYAPFRPVAAIYKATAAQLGIKDLS